MARTQQAIYDQMVTNYVSSALAAGITIDPTKWSTYNLQRLMMWTVAGGIAIFEQIFDTFKSDTEAQVAIAAPQTYAWIQAQMKLMQYDATTPQVLQFDTTTFAPYYPTVDATKRIITFCSVMPGAFGGTLIKCAKTVAGVPSPLDATAGTELDCAKSYIRLLAVPGINYQVTTAISDKIAVTAIVEYSGSYAGIIPVNNGTVVQAIKAYLANIPFDGIVTLDGLLSAILAVAGVVSCVLTEVQARANGTAYGSGTFMVYGNTWLSPSYGTAAGYIVGETGATHTLNDTITYRVV